MKKKYRKAVPDFSETVSRKGGLPDKRNVKKHVSVGREKRLMPTETENVVGAYETRKYNRTPSS